MISSSKIIARRVESFMLDRFVLLLLCRVIIFCQVKRAPLLNRYIVKIPRGSQDHKNFVAISITIFFPCAKSHMRKSTCKSHWSSRDCINTHHFKSLYALHFSFRFLDSPKHRWLRVGYVLPRQNLKQKRYDLSKLQFSWLDNNWRFGSIQKCARTREI